MSKLVDLGLLKKQLSEQVSNANMSDRVLPEPFKTYFTQFGDYNIEEYYAYTTKVSSRKSICLIPNQWFYISACCTQYFNELHKYREKLISLGVTEEQMEICHPSSDSNIPKEQTEFRYRENKANEFLSSYNGEDKLMLIRFLCDYEYWGGGKNIKRKNDFTDSPVLAIANTINASSGLIGALAKALGNDNKALSLLLESNEFGDWINNINNRSGYKPVIKTLQQIYYGAPGTGKSHKINKLTAGESVIRTTFHPDSDYSTFVGAYKPTTREVELRDVSGHKIVENGSVVREERIIYEFVGQAFLQAYANAWKLYAENPIEPAKQYLVIEEINRGNCAQIFGDLFQLLDRNDYGFSDYPIAADSDLGKYLKKELAGLILSNADSINSMYNGRDVVSEILNGKILLLPNNLYIWATMNTSDQSLFPIDSAFKRRWEWKYIPIDTEKEKWSISVNGKSYSWSSFLKQINNEIDDTTHSEDKKLGFYFCKATDGVISAEKFVSKVLFYLYNDVFKDYGFSRDFFKDANGKTIPFQMFFNCSDGSTNEYATETILKNLKVDLMENTVAGGSVDDLLDAPEEDMLDDDGNKPTSTSRDYSKYSINHDGRFDKRSLVRNTIFTFIKQHAELPDDDIISKWKSLNVFNKFILTESEYNRELDSSSDRSGRQSRFFDFELPQNHSHMYVYNQFNVERIEVFISRVNAQDWGIHLEKIE